METTQKDFDGVFRFTNATEEDFTALWNNKQYTFKAGTCSRMNIPEETSENIQEIRKKWAYKLATREFHKSPLYRDMAGQGHGMPPTYSDDRLTVWIQQCLEPLPEGKAEVSAIKAEPVKGKASKTVQAGQGLADVFKDEVPQEMGAM